MRHPFIRNVVRSIVAIWLGCTGSGCAGTPVAASDGSRSNAAADAGTAPGKSGPGVIANCRAEATEMSGPYRFNNNQWGRDKAKGKAEQCLLTRELAGHIERGWTWNWPGFDATVFAYPEIEFGWKPWSGGKSTDPVSRCE